MRPVSSLRRRWNRRGALGAFCVALLIPLTDGVTRAADLDLWAWWAAILIGELALVLACGRGTSGRAWLRALVTPLAGFALPSALALGAVLLLCGTLQPASLSAQQGAAPWQWLGARHPALLVACWAFFGAAWDRLDGEGPRFVQATLRRGLSSGAGVCVFFGGWAAPGVAEGSGFPLSPWGLALFALKVAALLALESRVRRGAPVSASATWHPKRQAVAFLSLGLAVFEVGAFGVGSADASGLGTLVVALGVLDMAWRRAWTQRWIVSPAAGL